MSRIIEAKAVISGEDRLSGVIDKINSKLKQVGKGAKISAEIDRLNKSLGNSRKQLDAIGRINAAQDKLAAARLGMTGAQARADQIATKLAAARKAGDAAATADLVSQQKAANRALSQATGAIERQSGALREARRELAGFGVPVTNLVAHEKALHASIARTTAALDKEGAALKRREDIQQRWDARRQRRQAEAAARSTFEGSLRPVPGRSAKPPKGGADRAELRSGALDLVGGAIGAYEAANAYKKAAAFDRRMTLIGQTADASRSEIDGLSASVHNLAQETATPVDNLAGGLEALVAQGRNLRESMEFLPSVARTAASTGSAVDDIAKTADSVGSNFKVASKDMQAAFDIMAAGGKAGQFELKDMARYLPSLGPATAAIGFAGKKGLADLVSMLQVMRKGSGTAEEAVSSMTNVINKMESDKTIKGFKDMGVDAKAAFAQARKEGRNLIEVFEELLQQATKGDKSKIGEIIDDQEFKRGALALMSFRGEWQKLSKSLQSTSAGTVSKDLKQVTSDAQAGVDRISNTYQRVTQALARTADAVGVTGRLQGAAGEIEAIATALEAVNEAWAKGGLKGVLDLGGKAASDAKAVVDDKLKDIRIADAEKNVATQQERIKQKEAEIARVRKVAESDHPSASVARDRVAMLEKELGTLRKGLTRVERSRDTAKAEPPAVPPNRPSVADRVPSLIDAAYKNKPALPFPQRPTAIPEHALRRGQPLPPRRPSDIDRVPMAPNEPAAPPQARLPGLDGRSGQLPAEAAATAQALAGLRGELQSTQAMLAGLQASGEYHSSPETSGLEARVAELAGRIEATLAQRTTPDQRLEATVKPDQISARVEQPVPVSVTGQAQVSVDNQVKVTVQVDESWVKATAQAAASKAVANMPLTGSGGRAGAASMPGAAATPGAAPAPAGP